MITYIVDAQKPAPILKGESILGTETYSKNPVRVVKANPYLVNITQSIELNSINIQTGVTMNDITSSEMPGDDCLAVSDINVTKDTIVTVKNKRISYYKTNGNFIQTIVLDSFIAPPLPQSIASFTIYGDPRIIYDSEFDRFTLAYLIWDSLSTQSSALVVFTSSSSNPMDSWNGIIILDTDFVPDSLFLDYINIGMSQNEIFITTDLMRVINPIYRDELVLAFNKTDFYSGNITNNSYKG